MDPFNETVKKTILDAYFITIRDFLEVVSKNSDSMEANLCVGINTINRVFEYTIINTKCIEKTKHYSQKSYCYYLEYTKQINDLYVSYNLNDMDAVMFVYKKTIFDLANADSKQSILTVNYDTIAIEHDELKELLNRMFKLTNTLFYWENDKITIIDHQTICNTFLNKFFKKIDSVEYVYRYLEIMQYKIDMTSDEYFALLTEYADKKIKNVDELEDNLLIKFYVDESTMIDKFRAGNMKEFLKWVYSPI